MAAASYTVTVRVTNSNEIMRILWFVASFHYYVLSLKMTGVVYACLRPKPRSDHQRAPSSLACALVVAFLHVLVHRSGSVPASRRTADGRPHLLHDAADQHYASASSRLSDTSYS